MTKKHLNLERRGSHRVAVRQVQRSRRASPQPEFTGSQEESSAKTSDWVAVKGASRLSSGQRLGPASLPLLPSCVLWRSWRPSPRQERGPRILLQVVCLLLLPAPSGAGGLSTEVLPVRWDVEWYSAQLHR